MCARSLSNMPVLLRSATGGGIGGRTVRVGVELGRALAQNGAVDAVYGKWTEMARRAPQLDAIGVGACTVPHCVRLLHAPPVVVRDGTREAGERGVGGVGQDGADAAVEQALAILSKADSERCLPEVRQKIEKDADDLFRLIGLQTSVEKYTPNFERGAVLDAWTGR